MPMEDMMYSVMIVEDDNKIAAILENHLKKYGYETICPADFRDIKSAFIRHQPDLVLLDINLPYYDGFYWCRSIRTFSNVPIIFISARVGEMNQVMAIENGGDDYITKPFHLDVVMAKIKGVLRRAYGEYALSQSNREVHELAGLYLDQDKFELEWQGKRVGLSQKEFRLISCLLKNNERVVSREALLEALWDDTDFVDDNTLSVNVTRVRRKLDELGIHQAIETIRGEGYRLHASWKKDVKEK
jgi:DNA-binding response OmpR family regulator